MQYIMNDYIIFTGNLTANLPEGYINFCCKFDGGNKLKGPNVVLGKEDVLVLL